ALDAAYLFTVHILLLDDAVQIAYGFVGIGNQGKGQLVLGLEVRVRLQGIARHANDDGARGQEIGVQVAEILAFSGAARGVVLGVEIQHDGTAAALFETERAYRAFGGERRGGLAYVRRRAGGAPAVGSRATITGRPSAIRML